MYLVKEILASDAFINVPNYFFKKHILLKPAHAFIVLRFNNSILFNLKY